MSAYLCPVPPKGQTVSVHGLATLKRWPTLATLFLYQHKVHFHFAKRIGRSSRIDGCEGQQRALKAPRMSNSRRWR